VICIYLSNASKPIEDTSKNASFIFRQAVLKFCSKCGAAQRQTAVYTVPCKDAPMSLAQGYAGATAFSQTFCLA
jgi:hypothetical protein